RKELIAWIGHDLQTPLASVSAIIEALADGVIEDSETEKRYFITAKKNIASLSHLIDDMFQMAQIDAGGLALNYESVVISDLISDSLESFTELAKRKEITLHGSVSPELGMVQMDVQRINRVLNNLLDNALRHTPSGGVVEVRSYPSDQNVNVEVIDDGEGITPEDLPQIFDLFYRGELSRRNSSAGAGLGLAISKGIIEAHGGKIEVHSHPGETVFSFTIPVRK
ncbi:MAG: ATP-binding protein, partial [Anaerolineales bacterium]